MFIIIYSQFRTRTYECDTRSPPSTRERDKSTTVDYLGMYHGCSLQLYNRGWYAGGVDNNVYTRRIDNIYYLWWDGRPPWPLPTTPQTERLRSFRTSTIFFDIFFYVQRGQVSMFFAWKEFVEKLLIINYFSHFFFFFVARTMDMEDHVYVHVSNLNM